MKQGGKNGAAAVLMNRGRVRMALDPVPQGFRVYARKRTQNPLPDPSPQRGASEGGSSGRGAPGGSSDRSEEDEVGMGRDNRVKNAKPPHVLIRMACTMTIGTSGLVGAPMLNSKTHVKIQQSQVFLIQSPILIVIRGTDLKTSGAGMVHS